MSTKKEKIFSFFWKKYEVMLQGSFRCLLLHEVALGAWRHVRALVMGLLGVVAGIIGAALALCLLPITIAVAVCLKPPILTKYKNTFFTPPTDSLKLEASDKAVPGPDELVKTLTA